MKRALTVSTRRLSLWMTLAAALALLGPAASALAQGGNPNPRIAPPNSKPYGLSYGEWGAEWWKWAIGIPLAENPVADETGEFADVDQAGPVWFLAGTFGDPTPLERTVTVPAGKALFFPLITFVLWGPEDLPVAIEIAELLGLDPADLSDEELLRLAANFSLVELSELTLTIDGVEIRDLESYLADSPGFSVDDDDLLDDFGFAPDGHELFVTAGYWIMLAPLPVGEHTIHFTATIDDSPLGPVGANVTYHITVVAPGQGGKSPLMPPQSGAFGKSFEEWNVLQTQFAIQQALGGVEDANDTVGRVRLLPGGEFSDLPPVSEIEVTLDAGTPFVAAPFFVFGELYDDGTEDDPDELAELLAFIFETTEVTTILDGKVLLDGSAAELDAFQFGPTYFDGPVPYAQPLPRGEDLNAVAALWVAGIGSVYRPLSVGEHTLELIIDVPFFDFGFDVTYKITVLPQ